MIAATHTKFDVERLREIDCRAVVARDLGQGKRRAQYVQYKCPFHDDRNPSFTVWEKGWKCYGCNKSGDVIGWAVEYHKKTFVEACELLGANQIITAAAPRRLTPTYQPILPPGADWQSAAWAVVEQAEKTLWGRDDRALQYLKNRGLTEDSIKRARLGYVPGSPTSWQTINGLNVPSGILIPWVIESGLWQLKVRRAAGKIKYQQVAGGRAGGLYGIDYLNSDDVVMIVEGEFDAMIINQTHLLSAVALGSASNTLHEQWIDRLIFAPRIYARLDADTAGTVAVQRLQALSKRVIPIQVPQGYKDCNDFALGDDFDFKWWLGLLAAEENYDSDTDDSHRYS